jgi:lysophospholipase L1-like esterase
MCGMPDAPAPKRRRRKLLWAVGVLATLLIVGELVARFGLGLGDPPLIVPDPALEYHFVPGTYHRFGNTIRVNEQFMRNAIDIEPRVLVMGDSVVNGGNLTDDSELATALLARRINGDVGNVSAGSWGPGNLLAWYRRFGTLGAETVIIVVSSHDAADAMKASPAPTRDPWLALDDGVGRYLWPRISRALGLNKTKPEPTIEQLATDTQRATAALTTLLEELKAAGVRVAVVHHAERSEAAPDGGWLDGHAALAEVAEAAGVPWIEARPIYRAAGVGSLYRDQIHPNAAGQQALVDVLAAAVEAAK